MSGLVMGAASWIRAIMIRTGMAFYRCATLYASRHPATVKAAVLFDCNQVCFFTDAYVDSAMVTAYGCGHFIFRDNPILALGVIAKAYAGAQSGQEGDQVRKRFLAYAIDAANEGRRKQ